MAGKSSDAGSSAASSFLQLGKGPSEAMLTMQRELLEAYEQASRTWLARVKSEVDLWSELAANMAATRSAPEAMDAYQKCVAQRMQMAADDGRRLFEDSQKIFQKITRSFSNGWPSGST